MIMVKKILKFPTGVNPMVFPGTREFRTSDPESIYDPRTKKLSTEAKTVGGAVYAGAVTGLDILKKAAKKKYRQ